MREQGGLLYLSLKTFSALGNFVNEDKDKILMRTTLFKNWLRVQSFENVFLGDRCLLFIVCSKYKSKHPSNPEMSSHHILRQFLARSTLFLFIDPCQKNADSFLKQFHQNSEMVFSFFPWKYTSFEESSLVSSGQSFITTHVFIAGLVK